MFLSAFSCPGYGEFAYFTGFRENKEQRRSGILYRNLDAFLGESDLVGSGPIN